MAIVIIPIVSIAPKFNFQISLESTVLFLKFRFNTRYGVWVMDIKDAENVPIVEGIIIRVGINLLSSHQARLPLSGQMIAFNFKNTFEDPDRDNFGSDVQLLYDDPTVEEAV